MLIQNSINLLYSTLNLDIVESEIYVRIFKKNWENLTLIDLPGFIVDAEERSSDLPAKIEEIAEKYANCENTIMIAVASALTDSANWKSIKFAKKFDPEGKRTIGVITKVDVNTSIIADNSY